MKFGLKPIFAMLGGLVAWFVVATAGNLVVRWLVGGYAAAEPSMNFTTPMLASRLVLGAISTVAAGAACALVAPRPNRTSYWFAAVLTVFFVAVHAALWDRFPLWYHAVFLLSVAPLAALGSRLVAPAGHVAN